MCEGAEDVPDSLRGLGSDGWKEALDSASHVGLLRRVGDGLYAVHPALPWFFRDLLERAFPGQDEWFEQAFTAAYGAYGSYLSKMFNRSAGLAISLLVAEEDNLVHALRLAGSARRWEHVQGILYGLNRLFVLQGRWAQWEKLIANVERDFADAHSDSLQEDLFLNLLRYRAEILQYMRDFEGAQAILLRLKRYYEGEGDDMSVAACLHQQGIFAQERGRLDEAEQWYRQSLAIAERINDADGQASTLHQLGRIAQEYRRFDEAERWCRQSLVIQQRIGDEHGTAVSFHTLGRLAEERRDFEAAEQWYRQSLAIRQRIGDEHGTAVTFHQLGRLAEERRDFEAAEQWYRQSLAVEERIGDEYGQAEYLPPVGAGCRRAEGF